MDTDIVIADIVTNELGISADRVVVYGQNYQAPTDDNLFVVISTRTSDIVGNTNKFDEATLEEVKSVASYTEIEIELTSRNREAYEKKEEAVMALTSTYSVQKQEELQFKLYRGQILDLTSIDGSSSLYRFIVKCKATHLITKRTSVPYFDKTRAIDLDIERK